MNTVSGDMKLTAIGGAAGRIPLFGLTAVDRMRDSSTAKTIRNGGALREAEALGASALREDSRGKSRTMTSC